VSGEDSKARGRNGSRSNHYSTHAIRQVGQVPFSSTDPQTKQTPNGPRSVGDRTASVGGFSGSLGGGGDDGGRDAGAATGAGVEGAGTSAAGAGPLAGFGEAGDGATGASSADFPSSAVDSSLSLRKRRKSAIEIDYESVCFRSFGRGSPHRFSPGQSTPVVSTSPSERLRSLGLELPPPPRPVGTYSPVVLEEGRAWVSGQIATEGGMPVHPGLVDRDVSLETARDLARRASLQGVSALAAALGSIDRVREIVRVTVFVASSPGFVRQHEVANGATEVLVQLFGENGRPSRVAVGVAQLPLNAAVEVDLIAATE